MVYVYLQILKDLYRTAQWQYICTKRVRNPGSIEGWYRGTPSHRSCSRQRRSAYLGGQTGIYGWPSFCSVIDYSKATVTPDRTSSGSYDWLRLGKGVTDRQFLLRSPAAVVAYRGRSLRVVALARTIGEYRWHEPSQEILRLVAAINDLCTINRDGRRPMVQSIDRCILRHRTSNRGILWPIVRAHVISCDGAYNQSWHPKTDGTINRGMQRSIARSIVASCDRSYDQSLLPTIIRGTKRFGIAGYKFWTWPSTLLRLICPLRPPTTSATSSRTYVLSTICPRFKHFRSHVGRSLVVSPVFISISLVYMFEILSEIGFRKHIVALLGARLKRLEQSNVITLNSETK